MDIPEPRSTPDRHAALERREAELERREEQLALAIQGSGAGLWDWNMETGEMEISERWAGMLGYTVAEIAPIDIALFERLTHPQDLARSDRVTEEYVLGIRTTHEVEVRMRHKDGHWRWILDRGMVVERDASGRPLRMSGLHIDITETKEAQEALRGLVAERDLFIKELHHRVKNNLAVVSYLLQLGLDRLEDLEAREVFVETLSRVDSIAGIYRRLVPAEDVGLVQCGAYLRELAESIVAAYARHSGRARLDLRIGEAALQADLAIPLGLILNEALTNTMKYAWPEGGAGEVSIEFGRSPREIYLRVSDDGVGLPPGFVLEEATSVGMSLQRLLARQLGAELGIAPAGADGRGTRLELRITERRRRHDDREVEAEPV